MAEARLGISEAAQAGNPNKRGRIVESAKKLGGWVTSFRGQNSKDGDIKLEEEIQSLEVQADIKSESDRVLLASELIDKRFMDVALITGQHKGIERVFGDEIWADFLEAKIKSRQLYGQPLSPELLKNLFSLLNKRSNPNHGTDYRREAKLATNNWRPVTYSIDDLRTIDANENLKFQPTEGPSLEGYYQTGYVVYPVSAPADIETRIRDICEWYNNEKQRIQGRVPDIAADSLSTSLIKNPNIRLAAQLQRRLVSVHPFPDTNGTLSRLLMNWSLEGSGLSAVPVYDVDTDTLDTEDQWAGRLRESYERQQIVLKRKAQLEEAGIEDVVEMMGLDEERTFYNSVYKYLHTGPVIRQNHNIGATFIFLNGLNWEKTRFEKEFSGKLQYDDFPEVSAGGLIPEAYMRIISKGGHLGIDYVRHRYLQDALVFRGLAIDRLKGDDQELLAFFIEPTIIGADYRTLADKRNIGRRDFKIDTGSVIQSAQDYNVYIGQAYLAEYYPYKAIGVTGKVLGKEYGLREGVNFLRRFWKKDRVSGELRHPITRVFKNQQHIDTGYYSTRKMPFFVSTSLDGREAAQFGFKNYGFPTEEGKFGVFMEVQAPRMGGLAASGVQNSNSGSGLSEIRESWESLGYEDEKELSIAGGIDPRSINAIAIARRDAKHIAPERYDVYCEREFIDGKEQLVITDFRVNPQGEKRVYQFNREKSQFEKILHQT